MSDYTSLFLSQSYQDTWDDYKRSLTRDNFACWDYVILTASNAQQAQGFEAQISERRKSGVLPAKTHFAVIPDKDGKRIGSGGFLQIILKNGATKSDIRNHLKDVFEDSAVDMWNFLIVA